MGQRLRALRLEKGIQQGEAARRLSISPAYLSLMESGRRAIHLPLLIKMLGLYGITMESFMASVGETRVDDGLAELVSDPLLRSLSLSETDLSSLSAKAVTTITALFNIYKSTRQQHQDLLQSVAARERGAEEPGGSALRFELTPFDEVTDFLEANHNWFPALEERAERVWAEAKLGRKATSQVLAELLRARYDIDVRLVNPDDPESSVIRRWDHERGVLTLSADMPEQRLKFQLANTLGMRLLDREGLHHDIHKDFDTRFSETRTLIKIHLANYFAGALLLPYGEFFREVQRTRYDLEHLTTLFESSYETVAHRVCNLSDPKRRGLPFYFLRVDLAGNISKRYSATPLRLPFHHGSCPKSAVHLAFLTPTVLRRQYEMHPDGSSYFVFAKVITEPLAGSAVRGTVYSIGLGTYADNAKQLTYADDRPFVDPKRMAVPAGVSCRFCERTDCNQRAAPSYKFAFRVDEYTKKDNFFSPLVDGDERADVSLAALKPRKKNSD